MKEKSCQLEGQERTPNASEEQKVEDEPCVERVLDSDAKKIVDLGSSVSIPQKLEDSNMVHYDQIADDMIL